MSSSRAIKTKRDETLLTNWEPAPERAPSLEREEKPIFARILAMAGLFFLVLGTLAYLAPNWQQITIIPPGLGLGLAILGLCPIFYHCFVERDRQFRYLYGFVGVALVLFGVVLRAFGFKAGYSSWFFLWGIPSLSIGLVLLLAVIRNETDQQFRRLMLYLVGGVGAAIILFSAYSIFRNPDYLAGEGAVMLLLALCYGGAYIGQQEAGDPNAYYLSLAIGGLGVVGFAAGLIRSIVGEAGFLIPNGIILMGFSLLYLTVSIGIVCDWPVVIIARRELAAYFYSPIAYLVIIGLLLIGWFMFWKFVVTIEQSTMSGRPMFEPIIGVYIFEIFPVIAQMFVVPVLTMRLFSEESRSGTMEMMLTAPVNEISIVVGKFLACWIFYMLTWVPWWLFLIALRFVGGEEFDYRPVLSFTIALGVISAGLLSMGLFFSSLTSNQIIAAVLAFVGMVAHLAFYFLKFLWARAREGGALNEVLSFVNFLDLWLNSLEGVIAPRFLVFHLSVAVFFLFATIKVLESRKWN